MKGPQEEQSDDSAYGNSDSEDDIVDGSSAVADALNEAGKKPRKLKRKAPEINGPLSSIQNFSNLDPCTLCGLRHGDQLGECMMTEKSEHLAEFREMLILHPEDEPLEKRVRKGSASFHRDLSLGFLLSSPLSPPSMKYYSNGDTCPSSWVSPLKLWSVRHLLFLPKRRQRLRVTTRPPVPRDLPPRQETRLPHPRQVAQRKYNQTPSLVPLNALLRQPLETLHKRNLDNP
jgi:hypothetical protein